MYGTGSVSYTHLDVYKRQQFGYTRCSKEDLAGGTPAENAEITKAIVNGTEKGPKRQAVCMNAGAALYIAGKAESLEAGVRKAEDLIDSGAAAALSLIHIYR